jgi:small-conductance mechanosensitive channel
MNLKQVLEYFNSYPLLKDISYTLLIFIIFFIIKKILITRLRESKDLRKNDKNLIIKRVHLSLNLAFIVFISVTWFSHLQSVFVSLFAVLAAIVIATKELIMCFTGGLLVYLSKSFKQGDRIEVDGIRGYVVDRNFSSTKILEIGPEKNSQQTTGTIVSLPNSIYLSKNIRNESYFEGYSIHAFMFKLRDENDLDLLENHLLQVANDVSSEYIENAKSKINKFCDKENLEIPTLEPRIKLAIDEKDGIHLVLKMPVKNSNVASVEQFLLRKYILFYQNNIKDQSNE